LRKESNYILDRKKRNKEIQDKYDYLIRIEGLQPRRVKNKLAQEYRLSYTTIENIVYRK